MIYSVTIQQGEIYSQVYIEVDDIGDLIIKQNNDVIAVESSVIPCFLTALTSLIEYNKLYRSQDKG